MLRRREFLHSSLAAGIASRQGAAAPAKPNFLFLIADDLTHRAIEALNNPEVSTPNLNRLMKQGCTFTHCFHQGSWLPAVCVASRSMLNSGLSAFRVQRNMAKAPLWGETMGSNGYDTSIAGKWHLSKPDLNRSFKHQSAVAGGMFESGPTAYNRPSAGNTWSPFDQSLKGQWLETKTWQPGADAPIKHSAQIFADAAADYLLKRKDTAKPFLLYVGFTSPHDPRQAPKAYVDRYPKERIKVPPNYMPEHPFDQGDKKIRDEVLAPFPRTREAVQLHRAEYYAHVDYFDNQIGHILDALEKSGQAANTYVILTADHGLAVGEHGLMGKQNLYDHSTRIPLIVSGPGVAAGKRVDEMVYQHSVFPTACELASIAVPSTVEFPSLADHLQGKGAGKHDAVFCFYRGFQRSVRTRDHKLIVYPQAGMTQLFDLKKDPWEVHNLATDRKHAALKQTLLERLHRFQKELEDDIPSVVAS